MKIIQERTNWNKSIISMVLKFVEWKWSKKKTNNKVILHNQNSRNVINTLTAKLWKNHRNKGSYRNSYDSLDVSLKEF